jgi:ketosteroid isomerase-like protein
VRILRDEISEENLAIVQRFADTVNQQDLAGFLALVDPEVVREQAFDAGDRVLVFANIQRRWRKTGELGDETRVGVLFTLRQGKVLRFQVFRDRQQALEAAELSQ